MSEKNFAVFRLQKIKSKSGANQVLRHMYRYSSCDHLMYPGNKNYDLMPPLPDGEKRSFYRSFDDLVGDQTIRKNAVIALECVFSGTHDLMHSEDFDLQKWAKKTMEWCSNSFGGKNNIVGAVLHRDETTYHIHALVVPINPETKKLNARGFVGGRAKLSILQDTYAECVSELGLNRGISKKISKKDHVAYQQYVNEKAREQLEKEEVARLTDEILKKEEYIEGSYLFTDIEL